MQLHPLDNVEVREDKHKYALSPIKQGENIIKYGFPIGHATRDIVVGEKVDPSNLRSNLEGQASWTYTPFTHPSQDVKQKTFMGYLRKNGEIGIRNELWIVPTVGCVNGIARQLAAKSGAKALCHPYGCSQLGGDHDTTMKVLRGLVKHPNAGGVLVLGLGCENNGIEKFREFLGEIDEERIRFLNTQDSANEMEDGLAILQQLQAIIEKDTRTPVPYSKLRIAVKCGGSDAYSGITANPVVGAAADEFYRYDATILMSEIPEVFGAEQVLLARSADREVFDKTARMIQAFRQYFLDHGEGIAENPSPGNIAGGISTLEEKSLGCVQKAGRLPLCGALNFGEQPSGSGLYMVNGPGNDMVAVTTLAASGAHMILFTTGRGTPLCGPVPTVKVATNTPLYENKKHWIDFNAGIALNGDVSAVGQDLFDLCIQTAEGEITRGERYGYEDIAIFKNGITL